ncbi:MAG: 50S ribosomal protein L21 [Planctomycetia bacterium]|nr:50S ribosomal protein L21 [Planctomycetia bacterium]
MYAIIVDGGRQLKVEPGQEIEINYRPLEAGSPLQFEQVLAVRSENGTKIGRPTVAGAVVKAEILGPMQGEKHYIQKFRRRKTYRRRTGHRQIFTRVRITEIKA